MTRPKGIKQHKYTPEQISFIRENIKKMTWGELTAKFNETFGTNLSRKALAATGKRYGIRSGRTGQFLKGNTPWNKGLKGWQAPGTEKTQFKKGNLPANHVSVGSETIDKDGYVKVKIGEPNKWEFKHRLIWEKSHGRQIPPNYVVIFGDGNKRNFNPDNLLLVSRKQLARMNQNRLIKNDAKLTETGILIAELINKTGELKRKAKGKSRG